MSEDGDSTLSKSSSSQRSRASQASKKPKLSQATARGSQSTSSETSANKEDPSLTSFPSFSPEQAKAKLPVADKKTTEPARTKSQKTRERKATLAGLTSASPSINRHNALFDDSPRASFDVPGAVNLATDEHIERLIARTGAVKLVRQYAQDLAQRDAELSALRIRADNRERELKRLLRLAEVPSAEIEKRLLRLETNSEQDVSHSGSNRQLSAGMQGMMQEAMSDDVGPDIGNGMDALSSDMETPTAQAVSIKSGSPSVHSRRGSNSNWQFWNSATPSQKSSRANSLQSREEHDPEATVKARGPSGNTVHIRALDAIFQGPGSNVKLAGGKASTVRKQKAGDEISVRSNQSGNSFTSWTKIFGGATNAKEAGGRARSNSTRENASKTSAAAADSAIAALSKIRTNPTKPPTASSQGGTVKPKPKRVATSSNLSTTNPDHGRKNSESQALGPVEMDAILPDIQRPPTMTHTSNLDLTHGLLTDRFGFIFDQRQQKRRNLGVKATHQKKLSGVQTLGNFRKNSDDSANGDGFTLPKRPETPLSIDEDSKKSWQDYLKIPATIGRPRELLSHTPSAGAIVTVNTAEGAITPPSGLRSTSIEVAAKSPLEPKQSNVTASSTGFVSLDTEQANDNEPVRILLEQLTELHDTLQSEKEVKWNAFLARVRAERAAIVPVSSERSLNNAPEADLIAGELIGIASLGRSAKTKGKYLQFKTLVLAGIPVSLRPKIWAECSGASSLRIPSYYDDLVTRSHEDTEIDPDTAQQIAADIRRTLTDNTFFRHGPGVQRLEELLRAYSLHNPHIGYCQGMNLITASLLLICATAEECFWLLVSIIDQILPSGYFDQSLLVARADQIVLRSYVAEILPKLDAKLSDLGVELEAVTFNWFLSLFSGVLTGGEALYRIWDVVLCLNSSEEDPNALRPNSASPEDGGSGVSGTLTPLTPSFPPSSLPTTIAEGTPPQQQEQHDGTSSPFLFQLSLALLKLNEPAILQLDSAAMVYSYVNHNMTNHAISIDGLVQAAEALRVRVRRRDVLERRARAVRELTGRA